MNPTPRSVLVYVGGDLVGDAVMKLPFVRALRAACPDASITWCAGKHKSAFADALQPLTVGLIDEVLEEAGFDRPLACLLRRPLGGRHFDWVIDTQRGVPVSFLIRRIRHDLFISGSADFLLSDRKPPRGYQRPSSMVAQMLDLLELATAVPPNLAVPPNPDAPLNLDDTTRAKAAAALPDGPVYIGLAPGAGGRNKCWPLENYIALARGQIAEGRVPVFILGPAEGEWAAELKAAVPEALFPTVTATADALSPLPSPSVGYSIALGARLAVAVANDAGSGHILAASDAPLVSLFGPTPAAKFAPAARRALVIEAQSFGSDEMSSIPLEAVSDAVDALLADADR
jgi:ADP-heptose:LPS heptosyltransferase